MVDSDPPRGDALRNVAVALLIALMHLVTAAEVGGRTGAAKPLMVAAGHEDLADFVPVDRLMRAAKAANLRSGPGTDYDQVGVLRVGELVWVTGETGNWLRIVTREAKAGFVYAPLLADAGGHRVAAEGTGAARGPREARRAVWQIHSLKPGETFDEDTHNRGTTFAFGPRDFITNVHVFRGVYQREKTLRSITLSQDGNPVKPTIQRIVAVDVAHDLVHFQTRVAVSHYLRPVFEDGLPLATYEDAANLGERLMLVGYLDGSLVTQEARGGIVYGDVLSYAFATEHADLSGLSGSPVINSEGKFTGVAFAAQTNMVFAIRIGHVARLLSDAAGVRCADFAALASCFLAGARQVADMAREGNVVALHAMGSEDGEVDNIDPDWAVDIDALRQAATVGFPPAQFDLAKHLYSRGDEEEGFEWLKRSAGNGDPQSIYNLGRAHYYGRGTPKDEALGRRYLRKSVGQGYFPASELLEEIGE